MFTGLVEDTGTVMALQRSGRTARLEIQTTLPPEEFQIGDSLAVNGVCLTLEAITGNTVRCFCLAETLSRTNLGELSSGSKVNLERALQVGARLGGHFVAGHVDFTAPILHCGRIQDDYEIQLAIPASQAPFFVEKGSVALDGVSLTIARCTEGSITICMIPHTAEVTTLSLKRPGDLLNVETDILGKYVVGTRRLSSDDALLQKLKENGFQ